MFAPELPTICVGLRGMVYYELHVQGADHDLHSGVYGGAAPNPLLAIAEIVTALKDRNGHIQIPGFYDRVVPPSDKERAAWASLPFDEKEYTEKEMGARELVGEPGVPLFDRVWARPTLELHGIRGGFTGEGAKTVIPAAARCKISMRLVPDQDPEAIWQAFRAHVEHICPPWATVHVQLVHYAEPVLLPTETPYMQAAVAALQDVFGREVVLMRSGGSIPIVSLFSKVLGAPSILMGFGLPDDNLHAPNEKMKLDNVFRGIDASARYLRLLAR
jgi:acetylornithine deacetylase/succinyl-diaminopimelate desuccinylase-like protein